MSMIKTCLGDNITVMKALEKDHILFDLAYCDMIYENHDLSWIYPVLSLLKDNGILIVQTDYHTVFKVGYDFPKLFSLKLINHLVWKNEWGNHPKDRFHQCFDDVLVFSKSGKWLFDSSKIQVPKATVNTKLNPSGRQTKTATAFIDDICLTTTSKERVKNSEGHLIKWQKPQKLYSRIISPFIKENDNILDPFMGSGSLGLWCKHNNINYYGIEIDEDTYHIANENIRNNGV